MARYDPYEEIDRERRAADNSEWRARLDAFWRWLKKRPAESWGFLVAGLLAGKFLL